MPPKPLKNSSSPQGSEEDDAVFINCSACLEDDFARLYTTEEHDIKFKIGKTEVGAHKLIIKARSKILKHILETSEKKDTFDITNYISNSTAFFLYLQYLYTGNIRLTKKQSFHVDFVDLLELAKTFEETELERKLIDISQDFITVDNVLKMLSTAHSHNIPDLVNTCIDFADKNAQLLLQHASLLALEPEKLKRIIARDSFVAEEIDILKMVVKYVEKNTNISQQDVRILVDEIRLPLIQRTKLQEILSPLDKDLKLKVDSSIAQRRDPKKKEILFHRFHTIANENLATSKNGCKVVSRFDDVDIDEYFCKLPETENERRELKIKFPRPSLLNHIRLELGHFNCHWKQGKPGAFSYYISGSVSTFLDGTTLIDYSQCECRGTQTLYFKPTVVKFLKITITSISIPRCYVRKFAERHYVRSLDCSYSTSHTIKYDEDYVVPVNLEICNRGRYFVIEERLISRRSEVTKLRIDYCQPFMVNTLKISCDESEDWSYVDEVFFSVDFRTWRSIFTGKEHGKTRFPLIIKFTKQPVAYIRIVGLFPYEEDDGLQSTRIAALSNRLRAEIMYL